MVTLREEFTRFYLSHHQGRKLIYEPSLGTCVVKAKFPTVHFLVVLPNVSILVGSIQFNLDSFFPLHVTLCPHVEKQLLF